MILLKISQICLVYSYMYVLHLSFNIIRFLFDNQSPEHIYYRWKLFSILQVCKISLVIEYTDLQIICTQSVYVCDSLVQSQFLFLFIKLSQGKALVVS